MDDIADMGALRHRLAHPPHVDEAGVGLNAVTYNAVGGHPQPEADGMFPRTPAATAAFSVGARFYSPALLNHCVRSYLWGAMYGAAHGITFDDELLYVSALLHDIGLTDAFDSHRVPFEEAGGDLAWVFGLAAGWPADRAERASEIIVLHMRGDVSPTADPESHILQVATSWEVVGRRPEEFPGEARAEILARYPRQGFGSEFLACFEDQAKRKPGSAAAASVANNAAGRFMANPLDG
jgi:HD domain